MGGPEKLEGGLSYYLLPPESFMDIIYNPTHFILYVTFICTTCGLFSKFWLEMSGRSTIDVLRMFHESEIEIASKQKKSIFKELDKNIPIAAVLGGVFIGFLSIFSDMIGTIGSGTSLLLIINIIYYYYEQFSKEKDVYSKLVNSVEF